MNTVGNYEFNPNNLLGRGAFGEVFKGVFKKNPSVKVAIKRVSKSKLGTATMIKSLTREIVTLSNLRHNNIVTLYECLETDNNVYLIMEFCNGGDLAAYIKKKGRIQQDMIKGFFRQLASAMKALHSRNIVHRDLKPQNIMLVRTTSSTNPQLIEITLKIADFGLARHLPQGYGAGTICGTYGYMAPEVQPGFGYDSKADLWSLGVIAYECLTGSQPRTSPPKIPVGTSRSLESFLIGLLKWNPSERMNFEAFYTHRFLR